MLEIIIMSLVFLLILVAIWYGLTKSKFGKKHFCYKDGKSLYSCGENISVCTTNDNIEKACNIVNKSTKENYKKCEKCDCDKKGVNNCLCSCDGDGDIDDECGCDCSNCDSDDRTSKDFDCDTNMDCKHCSNEVKNTVATAFPNATTLEKRDKYQMIMMRSQLEGGKCLNCECSTTKIYPCKLCKCPPKGECTKKK